MKKKNSTSISPEATLFEHTTSEWRLISKSKNSEEDLNFPLSGEHYLGRLDCEILLSDPHSSRRHAKLTLVDNEVRLEDLQSSNGTFVNGEKIKSTLLKHGDIVRFDRQEFILIGPEDTAKTMIRPADSVSATALSGTSRPLEQSTTEKKKPPPVEADANFKNTTGRRSPGEIQKDPDFAEALINQDSDQINNLDCRPSIELNDDDFQRLVAKSRRKHLEGNSSRENTPSLIVMTGASMGKIIQLDNDMMTIGRKEADIPLDEKSVSTEHAQIVRQGGKWKVIDMMSANGIYINGKKTQTAFLIPGDILRVGRIDLRFSNSISKPTPTEPATQDHPAHATPKPRKIIPTDGSKLPGWIYITLGFGFVLIIGAYILSLR